MFWGFISLCKWCCSNNSSDKIFYVMRDPPFIADTALNTDPLINKSHARYIIFYCYSVKQCPSQLSTASSTGLGGTAKCSLLRTATTLPTPASVPAHASTRLRRKRHIRPTPTIHRVTEFQEVSNEKTMQTFIIEEDWCTFAF